jgi:hypothetical protein
MAAWIDCSSASKSNNMLVNVPQLTIMNCTCAADLWNLGIYNLSRWGEYKCEEYNYNALLK